MSAVTEPAVPRLDSTGRVTQARVIVSEWTKLHSLRSTRWSLLVAFLLFQRQFVQSFMRAGIR